MGGLPPMGRFSPHEPPVSFTLRVAIAEFGGFASCEAAELSDGYFDT